MRILAFLLFATVAFGQNQVKVDSLQLEHQNAETDTLRVQLLLNISRHYYGNNYRLAAEYAKQAYELAAKKDLPQLKAISTRSLGNTFFFMGDYKKASQYYFEALKLYEADRDTLGTATLNVNLGAVHDRLSEFDKALAFYLKAQNLLNKLSNARQVESNKMLPTLYNNIANIYQSKGDFKSAQQYYEQAFTLAQETHNKSLQGMALNNLGKLYFTDLKQPQKAFEYLTQGLQVRLEVGDKSEIAKSYIQLSNYYFKMKDYVQARQTSNEAIRLAGEIGALETQKDGYQSLSLTEEALLNYPESLRAFKKFKHLSDSIQHQLAGSEITKLQLQYDFEKAEKARAEEKAKLRLRYITIIVVLSVFVVVALLIALIIRSRARQIELKRKNLAQDVEIKNKELTTNVMYLIRKNELINNVAERLLQFEKTSLGGNQKVIHEIIVDLQKEADNDTWKEFELRFNQVHSEFYNNLRKLYPGLSPADEKLCAFLRLNMSSKEIAAITQQSIKSVEVARARLRKKLNLTNTSSNLVTHLSGI